MAKKQMTMAEKSRKAKKLYRIERRRGSGKLSEENEVLEAVAKKMGVTKVTVQKYLQYKGDERKMLFPESFPIKKFSGSKAILVKILDDGTYVETQYGGFDVQTYEIRDGAYRKGISVVVYRSGY